MKILIAIALAVLPWMQPRTSPSPYHIVQANPSSFPSYGYPGIRDLHQVGITVHAPPLGPLPTGVVFTSPTGQQRTVPVTRVLASGPGVWIVDTAHFWEVGWAAGVGTVRLVEPSNRLAVGFVP